MAFRNRITGEYPVDHISIRNKYPNISFPSWFNEAPEHDWVFPTNPPENILDSLTYYYKEDTPKLENDKWIQTWKIIHRNNTELQQIKNSSIQIFINQIVQKTQQRLDAFASTRNYSSILSAATYATSKIPKFQKEGQYCVDKRDETWATLYSILDQVEAGTIPQPSSWEEVEAMLPVLEWPE